MAEPSEINFINKIYDLHIVGLSVNKIDYKNYTIEHIENVIKKEDVTRYKKYQDKSKQILEYKRKITLLGQSLISAIRR